MAGKNAEIISLVKKFLKKVQSSGIRIEKAYLYGSRVAGKANIYSDIDIAVISPDFSGDRFIDMSKLTRLTWDIDNRMEPVGFRPEEFNEDDPWAIQIIKYGIEIPVPRRN